MRIPGMLLVAAALIGTPFSMSQAVPSEDKQPVLVSQVRVEVVGEPENQGFIQLIPLKEGDPLTLKAVDNSIKQIFKTGLFSDVEVSRRGDRGGSLTFRLTRRLFTRRVEIRSSEEISRARLKDGIYALREDSAFSEDRLKKAAEELRQALRQQGIFSAELETDKAVNREAGTVDVFFEISSVKKYSIREIVFSGEPIVFSGTLIEKMNTKIGAEYVPSRLERDIEELKRLYADLGYRRAEITLRDSEFFDSDGTVSLNLEVRPNEKIEIVIEGADVPVDLVKPIWEARIFEEWGQAEGEAKILGYMRNQDYIFSKVSSHIERDEKNLRIIYQVFPGEKYKVQDVEYRGMTHFTPERLESELFIGETLPFFRKIGGGRLFELPAEIELLYMIEGFPDTKVDLNFEREGRKVKPVFFIDEGRQHKITEIGFEGAEFFSGEELLREIGSFVGGGFFQAKIQKDIEKLESYYLNKGIRGTEITARVQEVENDRFKVDFQISEGNKVRIDSILITGNRVTKKSIIRREFLLREGDFAFYDSIRETERRLERLGIFTDVQLEEIPVTSQTVNLLINVREGERHYAGLGLGIETLNEPRSFAVWNSVVRPRGTAELIRNNILGRGAQLSLVGQISLRDRRAVLSWEQPYFFGLRMQTFLNSWLEREERNSYTFERRGISLSTITPLSSSENMVFLTTLRVARTTLVELFIAESGVDRQFFPFSTTSLSGSFVWDNRDDPFNPTRGFFFSSVLEWAYPLFQTESNYQKSFNKFQHCFSLVPDLAFSSLVRLGLGRGRMPIHERFFAGGSNSFRGTEFDNLGPKDSDSLKPVGGKALILLTFEITFPFISKYKDLLGAFFYDSGNVFSKRKQLRVGDFRHAVGMGLRYRTPLGPVRLEVAWNMNGPIGENEVFAFITIGNVF